MSHHNEASRLTLAQFVDRGGGFYWVNSDGTTGPAVQMDYQAVPTGITRRCFCEVLRWSGKSAIQVVRLLKDDNQEEVVVAKIMNRPSDAQKLHSELNLLRGIRRKHVAAVIGSFIAGGRSEPQTGVLIFPLAVQNLDELLRSVSSYNEASNSRAWHPHRSTHQLLPYFVDNVILADFDILKAYDNATQAITYGSGDGTVMYSSKDVWSTNNPLSTKRGLEWDIISLGFVFLEMATVVFGKTLEDMRADMRILHPTSPGEPVVYPAALEGGQIRKWLQELRNVAADTP